MCQLKHQSVVDVEELNRQGAAILSRQATMKPYVVFDLLALEADKIVQGLEVVVITNLNHHSKRIRGGTHPKPT